MTGFIGIVCGLKSEADVISKALSNSSISADRARVGVAGANAERAEEIARSFSEQGAWLLLSIGVSGGLSPSLTPGDFLFSQRVVVGDTEIVSSGSDLFADRVDLAHRGRICGADIIIQTPADKATLFRRTKALAVDMESGGAAKAAVEAGIPFAALRAIADPADRALPPPAMDAVASDGSTKVFSTLMNTLFRPWYFPALIQLGRDSEAGLEKLLEVLPGLFTELASAKNA